VNKPKDYAKALVELMADKKMSEKKITDGFLRILVKNGDLKKAKEIMRLAEQLLVKKTGNKKIVVESARTIETKKLLNTFIEKGDAVQEKINPSLIAGVKITVDGEKQFDFSLKSKLDKLFS